ncbi:hypothetical protein [Pigmentiphaga aceris]|nr:hypothetical protein [Pigmentiphaga aceris]
MSHVGNQVLRIGLVHRLFAEAHPLGPVLATSRSYGIQFLGAFHDRLILGGNRLEVSIPGVVRVHEAIKERLLGKLVDFERSQDPHGLIDALAPQLVRHVVSTRVHVVKVREFLVQPTAQCPALRSSHLLEGDADRIGTDFLG